MAAQYKLKSEETNLCVSSPTRAGPSHGHLASGWSEHEERTYLVISLRKVVSSLYWEEEAGSSMCNSSLHFTLLNGSERSRKSDLGYASSPSQQNSRWLVGHIYITSEILLLYSFPDQVRLWPNWYGSITGLCVPTIINLAYFLNGYFDWLEPQKTYKWTV